MQHKSQVPATLHLNLFCLGSSDFPNRAAMILLITCSILSLGRNYVLNAQLLVRNACFS